MIAWDDLKYFLAMAEHGSLSAAARKLNVSQPTLSRRLTALEEDVGAELFSRTRTGLEMTTLGEQLLHHARHMQDDVLAIERLVTGQDTNLTGSVMISCIEAIGGRWLVGQLKPFRARYPGITVDIKVDNAASDLLRREADIALRMFRPVQNDLVAKRTVSMVYGYYATRGYLEKHGMPEHTRDLKNHCFILPHDEILAHTKTDPRKVYALSEAAAFRSNNMTALATAVEEGMGIGAYPCLMAAENDDLVRLFDDHTVFSSDIWLVAHAELKRNARIRAMYDYLGDMLHDNAAAFSGEG
ncbi:LysR family transcriptional regulator [Kordiimonas marina]|uniref:LysR family transcriptional regulator n=1 Tax=Kordiimonas marina TaxID=2872312 RepID=UPI001FF27D5E|nr:LysR family transcriptional regulator [Kordiimonas marina]MCJ9429127.1 LysR family transcriptional regulator [Kordiimonas marina]